MALSTPPSTPIPSSLSLPELDLNCDLGESEPPPLTRALLARVDSASIAAGGHAGDTDSIRFCLELAKKLGAHAGVHPGLPSRGDFGRTTPTALTPTHLETLLAEQVGHFAYLAADLRVPVHHIKLHGALYHAVESDPNLAFAYLVFTRRECPSAIVYARCRGQVSALAPRFPEITVWEEGFLDRGYTDDGQLVPRTEPNALLACPAEVRQRLRDLRDHGGLRTVTGGWLPLQPRTLCVHGDSPQAVELIEAIRLDLPRGTTRPVNGQSPVSR